MESKYGSWSLDENLTKTLNTTISMIGRNREDPSLFIKNTRVDEVSVLKTGDDKNV